MFLVLDHPLKPEPEDIERGFIKPEAVIHLKLDEAIADLTGRVRFSLAYEENPDDHETPEPELPDHNVSLIDTWRSCERWAPKIETLRIDTRDYAHTLTKIGPQP